MQKFFDPKSSLVFESLFGNEKNLFIAKDFINSQIHNVQIKTIKSFKVDNIAKKINSIDFICLNENNDSLMVELQIIHENQISKHLMDHSKGLLGAGDDLYIPDIIITIVNHMVFSGEDFLTTYKTDNPVGKDTMIYFIELPKFQLLLKDLKTSADAWIYFLKTASYTNEIPDELKFSGIYEAFEAIKNQNIKFQDSESIQNYDHEESKKIGIEQTQILTAKKMLALGLSHDQINLVTNITYEEIENLENSI